MSPPSSAARAALRDRGERGAPASALMVRNGTLLPGGIVYGYSGDGSETEALIHAKPQRCRLQNQRKRVCRTERGCRGITRHRFRESAPALPGSGRDIVKAERSLRCHAGGSRNRLPVTIGHPADKGAPFERHS